MNCIKALLLVLATLAIFCAGKTLAQDRSIPAPDSPFAFELLHSGIAAWQPPFGMTGWARDLVAADMDVDGDMDLLVNWHNMGLELYENKHGKFSALDLYQVGIHESGDIQLHMRASAMIRRINTLSEPGVYIWHDANPGGRWHVLIEPSELGESPPILRIRANESIKEFEGLPDLAVTRQASLQQREDAWAEIRLPALKQRLHFKFRTHSLGANVRFEQVDSPSLMPFFLGGALKKTATSVVSLRLSDPHGIAWVNVLGSAAPELFIARGGNRGRLKPPFEAKRNRFYIGEATKEVRYRLLPAEMVPAEYGRGRSVAWVDVDNDGVNELSLANKTSANALWFYSPEAEAYRDRAAEFGLGFYCGETQSWLDINNDGWQDMVFLTCYGSLGVAWNEQGRGFRIGNAEDIGLIMDLPESEEGLFDQAAFVPLDWNADGELDLWLTGIGAADENRVFLRSGAHYIDASKSYGLERLSGQLLMSAIDLDADGLLDAVFSGEQGGRVLHNAPVAQAENGRLPEIAALDTTYTEAGKFPAALAAAAAADFDGDGRPDLALASENQWWVLANRAEAEGDYLRVVIEASSPPIGTLIRARYSSGSALVQRYGSVASNGQSQALGPVYFGRSKADPLQALDFLLPGSGQWLSCSEGVADTMQVAISFPKGRDAPQCGPVGER